MTTGLDLKLRRTAQRLSVSDLAAAMGVSVSRISHIESRDRVTPEAARRYLVALGTFGTEQTERESA